jgi:hypothetical protein
MTSAAAATRRATQGDGRLQLRQGDVSKFDTAQVQPRGIAAPRCTRGGDGGGAVDAATSLHRPLHLRSRRASQLLGKAPDAGLGDYDIGRPYFYRRADGGFCRLRRALWQRAVPVQYRWPCHGRQSVNAKSTSRPGMARWRERLYSGLARIATSCVARPRVNVVNVAPSTPQGVATFTTVGPGCSSSVAATPCYAAMR